MVDGCKIGREPVKVFVKCPPHLLGEPVHILQNGIKKPCYLGIVGDRVFCMLSQAICTIDLQKRDACPSHFLAIPNTIKIWSPEEMTIAEHSDSVFVSDSYNNKIHKFKSTDGEYTTSTGGKGSRPGKLNRPNGLCVARTGSHLYVCDSDNHRIQVFDLDLKFVRCFGSQGSKPGQFMWPDNVAVGLNGLVYVTDLENHRIQCLTDRGIPILCIGNKGTGPGKFFEPNILKVVGNYIYVTDHMKVSVFTTSGQFITHFAIMCGTTNGLAIDENGFVFVSDHHNNRIVVF